MISLADLFKRSITKEQVKVVHEQTPKRRRISDFPVFKEGGSGTDDRISFPFQESFKPLFEAETGLMLFDGTYRYLKNEDEVHAAKQWEQKRRDYIFLRDCLDCSVALDFNLVEAGKYTDIGLAEHEAKVGRSADSIEFLIATVSEAVSDLLIYRQADAICAVPGAPDKDFDLPTVIAKGVVARHGGYEFVDGIRFENKDKSVKELSLDEKWDSLTASRLVIEQDVRNKDIVLIDDKYQSGTTAQFVASCLLEAGASSVLGLFCVKTWRDTDNS